MIVMTDLLLKFMLTLYAVGVIVLLVNILSLSLDILRMRRHTRVIDRYTRWHDRNPPRSKG